ncbi:MAG: heparinase II/III family protein, partial [Gaiellaceae bacterium]
WDGRPVLADAGTYTYEPGPERDWFRGTASHSTIRVDGRDQFRLWGAFRSGRLPEVKFRFAREGVLEASVRLRRRVRHVRRLEWSGDEILVRDLLDGLKKHRVESRLVWAPGADERIELAVYGGGDRREEPGWVSERFGERAETRVTTVLTELELPGELGFRIRCLE